ncbi:MAG TPA: carboxypeptidase regulatory-like domain-containing protein, partial [Pyrinomonadaceae bacterium]
LALLLLTAVVSYGQDLDDVTISGRITDSNGLAVVGATVTVTDQGSGAERTVTTNEDGRYRIIELKPGVYKVKASAAGFGAKERINLETVAAQNLQLDFTLAPADVQAEATVTVGDDDAPAVDTTRTIVGSTLSEREIEEIPNNARNPLDLVLTLGGTAEEALSTSDLSEDRNTNPRSTPLEQGNFTISGGASYSNNITIDGFDNNDDRSARDRFQPSLEAVSEVQVVRNQFSAEYGRAAGGRVNLALRRGTNRFRGRAYMLFRDDNFNANTWYNNSRGIPRLPLTNYNPGFVVSGPLSLPFYNGKRRTFFSFSYEHQRFEDTTLIDTYIPVVSNSRFELPSPTGSEQFCDNSNPSQCPASAGFVSPYSVIYPTPNIGNIITLRLDHKLTKNNDIRFGWQFGRRKNRRTSGTSVTRIEEALQAKNIDSDAFNITDTHVFGANTVNEAGFQWSRYTPSFQTDNPFDSVVLVGYRNPITSSVQTLIAGNSTASSLQNFSDNRDEQRYQIKDTVTHIAGSHTMKFGFDVQHVNSKTLALADATGTFNFNNVLNYSNNVVTRFRQNFGTASDVTNTYWGAFFNDEFRIAPSFTMSFGLRYERETAVDDNNNFGPRFALAWDPNKKGKEVIRFGAAVVYNRVLLRTIGDFIQNRLGSVASFDTNTIPTSTGAGTLNPRNQILAVISQQFPSGYGSAEDLRSAIATAQCGTAASPVPCSSDFGFIRNTGNSGNPLRSVADDIKIPESYQFNIGYEREIADSWVFEANYTWNKTAHLWREYNINLPVLPSGFADYTAYLLANSFSFTNFNGSSRTYRFWLGPTTDTSGVARNSANANQPPSDPLSSATCSTTAAVVCWINLNTTNTSTTTPNTNAGDGVSSNSIGGPIGIARAALQHLRPDPSVDEMEQVSSIGNSFYNGLVLEFRRRYRKLGHGFGASFRFAYTLSMLKDDGLNNTTNAEVNGDFSREWTRATQDRRHRFAFVGTFDTPSWFGKLRLSPAVRAASSAPFNLGYGVDRNLNDTSTDRVMFSGNFDDIVWRQPGTPVPTDLIAQFSLQPIGSIGGNIPRNVGRGPGQFFFDLGVSREWRFGERFRLRPNIEFGNILNVAKFSYGSEFVDVVGANASATALANFLVPTRTYRQRDIRFGLRFDF